MRDARVLCSSSPNWFEVYFCPDVRVNSDNLFLRKFFISFINNKFLLLFERTIWRTFFVLFFSDFHSEPVKLFPVCSVSFFSVCYYYTLQHQPISFCPRSPTELTSHFVLKSCLLESSQFLIFPGFNVHF